jgi:hypothetical protein
LGSVLSAVKGVPCPPSRIALLDFSSGVVGDIGKALGADSSAVSKGLSLVGPLLLTSMTKQAAQPGGPESLMSCCRKERADCSAAFGGMLGGITGGAAGGATVPCPPCWVRGSTPSAVR